MHTLVRTIAGQFRNVTTALRRKLRRTQVLITALSSTLSMYGSLRDTHCV